LGFFGTGALRFGDELSDLGTKLNLPLSDCDFGDALGKFLKTGARPDSEPRALGNVSTSWNGEWAALGGRDCRL